MFLKKLNLKIASLVLAMAMVLPGATAWAEVDEAAVLLDIIQRGATAEAAEYVRDGTVQAALGYDFDVYNRLAYPEYVWAAVIKAGEVTADTLKSAFTAAVDESIVKKEISVENYVYFRFDYDHYINLEPGRKTDYQVLLSFTVPQAETLLAAEFTLAAGGAPNGGLYMNPQAEPRDFGAAGRYEAYADDMAETQTPEHIYWRNTLNAITGGEALALTFADGSLTAPLDANIAGIKASGLAEFATSLNRETETIDWEQAKLRLTVDDTVAQHNILARLNGAQNMEEVKAVIAENNGALGFDLSALHNMDYVYQALLDRIRAGESFTIESLQKAFFAAVQENTIVKEYAPANYFYLNDVAYYEKNKMLLLNTRTKESYTIMDYLPYVDFSVTNISAIRKLVFKTYGNVRERSTGMQYILVNPAIEFPAPGEYPEASPEYQAVHSYITNPETGKEIYQIIDKTEFEYLGEPSANYTGYFQKDVTGQLLGRLQAGADGLDRANAAFFINKYRNNNEMSIHKSGLIVTYDATVYKDNLAADIAGKTTAAELEAIAEEYAGVLGLDLKALGNMQYVYTRMEQLIQDGAVLTPENFADIFNMAVEQNTVKRTIGVNDYVFVVKILYTDQKYNETGVWINQWDRTSFNTYCTSGYFDFVIPAADRLKNIEMKSDITLRAVDSQNNHHIRWQTAGMPEVTEADGKYDILAADGNTGPVFTKWYTDYMKYAAKDNQVPLLFTVNHETFPAVELGKRGQAEIDITDGVLSGVQAAADETGTAKLAFVAEGGGNGEMYWQNTKLALTYDTTFDRATVEQALTGVTTAEQARALIEQYNATVFNVNTEALANMDIVYQAVAGEILSGAVTTVAGVVDTFNRVVGENLIEILYTPDNYALFRPDRGADAFNSVILKERATVNSRAFTVDNKEAQDRVVLSLGRVSLYHIRPLVEFDVLNTNAVKSIVFHPGLENDAISVVLKYTTENSFPTDGTAGEYWKDSPECTAVSTYLANLPRYASPINGNTDMTSTVLPALRAQEATGAPASLTLAVEYGGNTNVMLDDMQLAVTYDMTLLEEAEQQAVLSARKAAAIYQNADNKIDVRYTAVEAVVRNLTKSSADVTLAAAAYQGGRLVGIQTVICEGMQSQEKRTVTWDDFAGLEYDEIKVIALDSLQMLKPLADSAII